MEEAILTWKVRLERKDLMKTPMFPRKPREDNCWRIWYRHVVSYAFSRSKKMANTDSWRANADVMYVSKWASGSAVLRARRKPNWKGKGDYEIQDTTLSGS